MSHDLDDLQHRLELITAAQLPADVDLDRESATLRSAWLAFGGLIEAVQTEVGEAAVPLSPPAARRWRWRWLAVTALCASLFLAATLVFHLGGGARPAATRLPVEMAKTPAAAATNRQDVSPQQPVVSGSRQVRVSLSSTVKNNPASTALGDRRVVWYDALDEQMDRVGRMVVQVHDESLASAAGESFIRYELEDFRKSIDEGPF